MPSLRINMYAIQFVMYTIVLIQFSCNLTHNKEQRALIISHEPLNIISNKDNYFEVGKLLNSGAK